MARVWIPGTDGFGFFVDVPDDVAEEVNANPGMANQIVAEHIKQQQYTGPTTRGNPRSRGIVAEPEGSPANTIRKEGANTEIRGSRFRSIIDPNSFQVSPWQDKAPTIMNRGNEESARERAVSSIKRRLQPVPDYNYEIGTQSIPSSRKIDFSGSVGNRDVGMSPIQSRIIAKRFNREEPDVSPMAPAQVSETYNPKPGVGAMAAPSIAQQPEMTAKQFSMEPLNIQPMAAPLISEEEAKRRAIKNRLRTV